MLKTSMERVYYRFFVLLTVTAACTAFSFADDLDASLEAQKKKAQRHVYSDVALLHNQNLFVPRETSAEEKNLDKKLEAMEAEQDAQASARQLAARGSGAATLARPAENKNWLTPALLDNDTESSLTNSAAEDSWLVRELDRQKELKAKEAAATKDKELVDRLLREKTSPKSNSPELDRLKKYQPAPPQLFGSKEKDPDAPLYMTPQSGIPDPTEAVRLTSRKDTPVTPPLFSPQSSRVSSFPDKDPLRSTRSPSLTPNLGASARPSSIRSTLSPDWSSPAPPVLTPMEMIRKSSPINKPDPFADDRMPHVKTSIWQ
ncbi:MAG TPA: hypothetical protein PKI68_07415 [Pontiellaceae bacterium]|nr:hypothetical protein [Pontiellaceae bacterium]